MYDPMMIGGEALRINLVLYTDAFVIRGTIRTRQQRITDILNGGDGNDILEGGDGADSVTGDAAQPEATIVERLFDAGTALGAVGGDWSQPPTRASAATRHSDARKPSDGHFMI